MILSSTSRRLAAGLLAGATLLAAGFATAQPPAGKTPKSKATQSIVNIPYDQYRLDNGLTVILHEDHTHPLVVVNINVNVGSGNEPAKRTGFAHLFEHLMFMGTEKVPEKKFDEWMEREGGFNNAWTSNDRTDYYDVGPSHTLPLLLWLEADRHRALGDQIDQGKLDTQRSVVRNERRQQTENRPYEVARLRLPELLFPEGHPYHHPVIGSHEDLEAATVVDVRSFFKTWYVPANVSMVVAGDFDPAQARELIERYFGPIPKSAEPGELPKPSKAAKLGSVVRETLEDNVSLPKVMMSWLSPAAYKRGDAELDLLSEILTEGKSSRLYKSLVYDKELAQTVSAYQASKKLRSHFTVEAIARPGVKLADLEAAIDAELEKVRTQPVTASELTRAKNQYEASFIARMQSLATRASMLNGYFSHHRNPGYVAKDLQRYLDPSAADIQKIASQVLEPDQRVILHIVPRGEKAKGAR